MNGHRFLLHFAGQWHALSRWITDGDRANAAAARRIWVAVAVSLLIHVATLWKMPPVQFPGSREAEERSGPLIVQLTPPASPPPAAPPIRPRERVQLPPKTAPPPIRPRERVQIPPKPPPPPKKARERPPPPPAVIARQDTAPALRRREPPPVPVPAPAPSPPAGDLAAYVEARRRARGDNERASPSPAPEAATSAPPESENARATRLAAANLGLDRKPTFGPEPRKGGGIFQITRMSNDYAEFMFYGWNKEIRRDTAQTIDVRKGSHSDVRLAVVRRMIAIIREHEQGDFVWESHRLNRNVTLSARQRDTAGLEEFLMREFFEDARRPAQRQ